MKYAFYTSKSYKKFLKKKKIYLNIYSKLRCDNQIKLKCYFVVVVVGRYDKLYSHIELWTYVLKLHTKQ